MHHAVFAQTFDGCHCATICLSGEHCATLDRFTVEMNGASATTRCVTTNVCASELQLIAQEMYEQCARLYIFFLLGSIDRDADLHEIPPCARMSW